VRLPAGCWASRLCPAAAAFADDYTIDPTGIETITGIYGYGFFGVDTASPATPGSIQGHQGFTYTGTSSGETGTLNGFESNATDSFGATNQEVLVTSSSGTDAPPVGSVLDTYTLGDSGYANIYSAIPTGGGNYEITDTIVTPFGNFDIPTTFDAVQVETTSAIELPGGDVLDPTGALAYTGVNGLPPVDAAVQGTQTFGYTNADGTTGSFGADVTNTLDEFGDSTETVLVTSGSDPDAPIGSVFETVTFGDTGIESFYTDIPSTVGGANVITDILQTPLGDFTIPTSLDAIAGAVTDLLSAASG
jgi:hypothetical protein